MCGYGFIRSISGNLFGNCFLIKGAGTRTGVDLQLFETWGTSAQAHAYVIENILLFIPFGFLVPFVFFKCRNAIGTFCLGIFLSIACEYAQFITQRGYCQLDDVVMNTLGTILGYMGYWCICCIFHLICRVKKRLGKGLLPMKKIQYWIPAILMMIAIFYFSSQPGDISGDLSGGISYKIVSLVSDLFQKDWNHEKILIWAEKMDFPVRKLAHLTEYALLGLAMAFGVQGGFNDHSTANRKKMRNNKIGYRHLYLYVQMIGSLYAASDELHQLFVPGRAGRIGDVVIDSIGVLIGWFVWLFVV